MTIRASLLLELNDFAVLASTDSRQEAFRVVGGPISFGARMAGATIVRAHGYRSSTATKHNGAHRGRPVPLRHAGIIAPSGCRAGHDHAFRAPDEHAGEPRTS